MDPLFNAIIDGDLEIFNRLFDEDNLFICIYLACYHNRVSILTSITERGFLIRKDSFPVMKQVTLSDPKIRFSKKKIDLLTLCALRNSLEVMKYLISLGWNI